MAAQFTISFKQLEIKLKRGRVVSTCCHVYLSSMRYSQISVMFIFRRVKRKSSKSHKKRVANSIARVPPPDPE
ncbi:hypothetical protein GBA52_002844 [Prunus armeniaca]|nr:hypothetical protein GBA52_002844 [Prunus armeniaca]